MNQERQRDWLEVESQDVESEDMDLHELDLEEVDLPSKESLDDEFLVIELKRKRVTF